MIRVFESQFCNIPQKRSLLSQQSAQTIRPFLRYRIFTFSTTKGVLKLQMLHIFLEILKKWLLHPPERKDRANSRRP